MDLLTPFNHEMQIKSADNRVLQEQLQNKVNIFLEVDSTTCFICLCDLSLLFYNVDVLFDLSVC